MAVGGILDAVEAGKLLGISASAVHALAQRGTLPSQWLHGKRVWMRAAVLRLLNDAEYRRRSRAPAQLTLAGTELTTEEAIRHAQAMKLQAPDGFEQSKRRRGGGC